MNVVLFYHSALSDWNHGNAHFLRGFATELQARGHRVDIFEPCDAWSATSLVADHGQPALEATLNAYPALQVTRYSPASLHLEHLLEPADLVIVHEWNTHDLVAGIGAHHRRHGGYVLLFHDTHHRSVTEPAAMAAYDLSEYDGVLAFGEVVRQRYLDHGWANRAWTWHEAADTRVFGPRRGQSIEGDLVWIGNWGDEERSRELTEFLVEPVRRLRLQGAVHGVRYPAPALDALAAAGLSYRGWLPNYAVPEAFGRHLMTVHVPRRPYVEALPGIPTIRPFEALACGIPLVSAPWDDVERLFTAGEDYLVAGSGEEMIEALETLRRDAALRASIGHRGRRTVLSRHTCEHRVDELLGIVGAIKPDGAAVLNEAPGLGPLLSCNSREQTA